MTKEVDKLTKMLDDELSEMVNLDKKYTGIEGVIYISSKEGQHGPRVKYYKKPGHSQPSAVIKVPTKSDEEPITLRDDLGMKPAVKQMVLAFVSINRMKILEFWYHATDMLKDEVDNLVGSMEKV